MTLIALLSWIVAVGLLYAPVLIKLARDWATDENYAHGFLVAPLALVLAWQQRDRFSRAPLRPSALGLILIAGSLALFAVGSLGAELFTTRVSLVGLIAGTIVYVCGWRHLRIVAFPVAFLLFAIPLPTIVFDQMTQSLQLVASGLGERMLRAADIPVLRDGNVLTLSTITLQVTDACSGIRSLMSLLAVTSLGAYVFEPTLVRGAALTLSAVPLAIVLNGVRVAATGMAASRFGPDMARGFVHEAAGWVIFVVALACVWLLHRAMRWARRSAAPHLLEAA